MCMPSAPCTPNNAEKMVEREDRTRSIQLNLLSRDAFLSSDKLRLAQMKY